MKRGLPPLPAGQRETIDDLPSDLAAIRKVLEEIIQCSRPLQTNPNCLYILKLTEGALKKTMKAQKVAKTAIICK